MLKLGKEPLPMIGKLSEMLVSGNRAGFLDVGSSPRGPLDLLKMQSPSSSPRALKSYDGGGVGLGIVAALEKSSSHNNGRAKYAVCSHSSNRSDPIPVGSGQKSDEGLHEHEEEEEDSEENYTFVTCHGRNKSVTRVYYDGGDCKTITEPHVSSATCNVNHNQNQNQNHKRKQAPVYPTSDFLSSCHLCSKKLDGLDIYMYRGDKAFCSTECRATQIMNDEADERKEQCRSEASRRSADVSSSPYPRDQIFFCTAILAI